MPPGFFRITHSRSGSSADINKNARGKYIYLCYKRGVGPPVTGITVIFRDLGEIAPPGFEMIEHTTGGRRANLNAGAAGQVFLFSCS